ncbi:FIGNL1-interacting regulator of recombination and mitosis isoform X2 [Phascolarctos cinereus]|uniref:Uncharacterized protein C1orf112 homolog isoform X2 n=1 Tax=Phascolarctos cinereus TaxID=38626 RepID=A0A6P5JGV9_PHACI|nr:uncharacterized protein C1orf112 homolog isoform X2 [Phascolarctos cinereus]
MSQDRAEPATTIMLEELAGWSEDLCRQELPSVLPRLLSIYQCSDNWKDHIRVLKILTEMFLPHINYLALEQSFFSQVLPKTVKLFDHMMYDLSSQAGELSSQNLELQATLRNILQSMVQLLGALRGCVQHVCTLQESIVLENIHSLPSSVLHVIKSTFIHCKNSDSVYSGRLHLVSDLLQALFKEAYSLQKHFMELLDMVCMDASVVEEDISDMVSVIHSVLDICSVISDMDQAFHANTWKFIIKQSLKHQAVIKSQLKHKDIVAALSEDILFSFHSCLQLAEQMTQSETQDSADNKLFHKRVKLCRFFANSLLHYTKEFLPFLSDSCCTLHQLYLQIHSKFPPSLYATMIPKTQEKEILGVFLVTLDPLISQLLSFTPFVEAVLGDKLDLSSELQLPQCLLLVNIMDKLPSQPENVQSLWCERSQFPEHKPRMSLLEAIFYSFEQCSGELSLPANLPEVMTKGQAEVSVTLYQYVCVHLCNFVASFHPSLFPELDVTLLNAVLSSGMITSLLAMDTWCFLARYGTAELCAHHVFIIAHLIKSCPGECYQLTNLSVLLRRLLFLMDTDHQMEFIQKFSPKEAENLPLWQHISFKAFSPELKSQIANEVTMVGIAQCKKWLSSRHTLGELESVNVALSALFTVCNSTSEALEMGQQAGVLEAVSPLWTILHVKQVSSQPYVQWTLSLLLPLLGFFIQAIEPQLISQVVTLQASLLKLDPPDYVRLAILDFVSSLGRIFIPQAIQEKVLPSLPSIFTLLLTDKSWLIEQHTLEAFTDFAEGTNHEDTVPQCLNSEETKNKVICFLEKTRMVDETARERVYRMKQEKQVLNGHFVKVKVERERCFSTLQPCAKRIRQEFPLEDEFRSTLQTAEGALEAVQLLLQRSPAPDWLTVKLEELQTKINTLKSCAQPSASPCNENT